METAESQNRRRDEGGEITSAVIGAAIEVHRTLGPGLLESIYETCLCHEIELRHVRHARQVPLDLQYKGLRLDAALRMDLVVERRVVVEIKTVEVILPVHRAQLLTYLRVGRYPLGLVLNFNVTALPAGIVRMALRPSS
jgi:GxxExxY protein